MRQRMIMFLIPALILAAMISPVTELAAQQSAAAASDTPAASPAATDAGASTAAPDTQVTKADTANGGGAGTTVASSATKPEDQAPKPGGLKDWVKAHQRTKKAAFLGALGGAVAGAAIAARTGRSILGGALIGAAAGGLAGFLIGKNQDKIYAGRDEAVRQANYDPSQGYVMRVEQLSFEPANAKPGEKATLSIRYLVIGPDPHEQITVNCFRGIKYQDNYVMGDGPSSFVVPRGGGIVTTTSTITIPKDAPAGTYAVEATFDDPGGRFQGGKSRPLYIAS